MPSLDLNFLQTVSPMINRFTNPSSPDFNRNYSGGEEVAASDEQVNVHHTQLGNAVDLPSFSPVSLLGQPVISDSVTIRTSTADGGLTPNNVRVNTSVDLEGGVYNSMSFKGSDGQRYTEREDRTSEGVVTKQYTRQQDNATLEAAMNPTEITEAEFEAAKEASNISLDLDNLDKEADGSLELDQQLLDQVADADDQAVAPPPPPPPPDFSPPGLPPGLESFLGGLPPSFASLFLPG